MWFAVRDNAFPPGRRRYIGGTLTADAFLRMCELFDGRNEAAVMASLQRQGLVMNVFGDAGNYRLALLSFAERDEIRASVSQSHRGHLVDVDGVTMTLREGAQRREVPVAEGSWFINCTTHFRPTPHEPILQDDGAVCAPQFAMGFSGTSAYYVTHLWYRNELAPVAPVLPRPRRRRAEAPLRHTRRAHGDGQHGAGGRPLAAVDLCEVPGRPQQVVPALPAASGDVPVMSQRGQVLRKTEALLKTRYSDASEDKNESIRPESVVAAQLRTPTHEIRAMHRL